MGVGDGRMSVASGTGQSDEASDEITITDAIRAALRAEIRRTGVTAIMLLKGRRDVPDGLAARTVNRWLAGLLSTARRSHLDYVMAQWSDRSDDAGRMTSDGRKLSRRGARHPATGETWIPVTNAMSAHLRDELTRTGIQSAAILRGVSGLPDGLNQRVVRGWLYGETQATNEAYWNFVVAYLASRPSFPVERG